MLTAYFPFSAVAGNRNSFFVPESGNLLGIGYNTDGQLGVGDRSTQTKLSSIRIPNCEYVAPGYSHTIFLDQDGGCWSTGSNRCGALGLDIAGYTQNPILIEGIPQMKYISSGCDHSLFLDAEGSVWGCGLNKSGQLGTGDHKTSHNQLTKIDNIPEIEYISCGYDHSLLLDRQGGVWSFGSNAFGQLGFRTNDATVKIPTQIENIPRMNLVASGCHSLFLDKQGSVWACGGNELGELGLGDRNQRDVPEQIKSIPTSVQFIACGSEHSMFLDNEQNVWGCGSNMSGELGLGHASRTLSPAKLPKLDNIQFISCGSQHSLFVSGDGKVSYCGSDSLHYYIKKNEAKNQMYHFPAKLKVPKVRTTVLSTQNVKSARAV